MPILGLTATSTSHVTEDVKKILSIKTALVFKAPLNRPNLFYEVRPKPENHEACLDLFEELLSQEFKNKSGIIYTLTVKDVENLTKGKLKTKMCALNHTWARVFFKGGRGIFFFHFLILKASGLKKHFLRENLF